MRRHSTALHREKIRRRDPPRRPDRQESLRFAAGRIERCACRARLFARETLGELRVDHSFLLKGDDFTWTRSRLMRWKWEEVYALEHTLRQMYYSGCTIPSPVSD